jgi:predicted nucleic acid-binding protein
MGQNFLIDTNVVIYYMDGKIPELHYERVSEIFRDSFNISTITKIEVMGWHKITDSDKKRLLTFIDNANVIYIDEGIEQKSIELKQEMKIATPDAIIAATACVYDLVLVTRNEKDFKSISGLSLYNPFKE